MDKRIGDFIDRYMENFRPYKNGVWCYEDGILMTAVYDMYQATGERKYRDFVARFYDSMIGEDGTIRNYDPEKYSIDDVCPGIGLMKLYRDDRKEKYRAALDAMYGQMMRHPRTSEGSFWHKQIYPYQVWMDGIYMGVLFVAMYAREFGKEESARDVDTQLHTLLNRLYDEKRQLFVHAYDERKVMQWADPVTGRSPNVWSRACGWVMMAMADIYEELGLDICADILNRLIDGLTPWLDEGMLRQVVDVRKEPNYRETSGSAMMAYAILKGKRLGMVKDDKTGRAVFEGILSHEFDGNNLSGICRVAGLDNKNRDGSFEYYMSEDRVSNEVKGVAPFIMAYSELIGHKKLILMGDSTMQYNDETTFPQVGWPQGLTPYLQRGVRVLNFAVNGRSTRSFLALGDYEKALAEVDGGSIVLIEFGHNDEHKAQPERFTTPAEYKSNLRKMVRECRARGGFAVLLTPIARRYFREDGSIDLSCHREYREAVLELAREEGAACIDMTRLTGELLSEYGPEASKGLFMQLEKGVFPNYPDGMTDNTHLVQKGADAVAGLFAEQAGKITEFEGWLS